MSKDKDMLIQLRFTGKTCVAVFLWDEEGSTKRSRLYLENVTYRGIHAEVKGHCPFIKVKEITEYSEENFIIRLSSSKCKAKDGVLKEEARKVWEILSESAVKEEIDYLYHMKDLKWNY